MSEVADGWNDRRIERKREELIAKMYPDVNRRPWGFDGNVWCALAYEIRDDLTATIEALRAQVAAQAEWEDVPVGERYVGRTGEWIRYDKGQLSQLIDPNDEPVVIEFPYEWRLQRKREGQG